MAFFQIQLTQLIYFWVAEYENHIIVVLADNQYLGRFKAIKISKFGKFPVLRKNAEISLTYGIVLKFGQDHHNDKRNISCKFHQNPTSGDRRNFATCQNVKFSILSKKGT